MTMPPNTSDLAPSRQLKVSIGGIQKLSLVDYPGLCFSLVAICGAVIAIILNWYCLNG